MLTEKFINIANKFMDGGTLNETLSTADIKKWQRVYQNFGFFVYTIHLDTKWENDRTFRTTKDYKLYFKYILLNNKHYLVPYQVLVKDGTVFSNTGYLDYKKDPNHKRRAISNKDFNKLLEFHAKRELTKIHKLINKYYPNYMKQHKDFATSNRLVTIKPPYTELINKY